MSGRITTPFFDKICGKTKKKKQLSFPKFCVAVYNSKPQAGTNLISLRVSWMVGSFNNEFGFNIICILPFIRQKEQRLVENSHFQDQYKGEGISYY